MFGRCLTQMCLREGYDLLSCFNGWWLHWGQGYLLGQITHHHWFEGFDPPWAAVAYDIFGFQFWACDREGNEFNLFHLWTFKVLAPSFKLISRIGIVGFSVVNTSRSAVTVGSVNRSRQLGPRGLLGPEILNHLCAFEKSQYLSEKGSVWFPFTGIQHVNLILGLTFLWVWDL